METTEATDLRCTCEPYEHPVPPNTFMLGQPFMSLSDIHIEATNEDLDLHDVLFLEGGTQVWIDKETDVVWVWPCSRANGRTPRPTAYQGVRRPCTCTGR